MALIWRQHGAYSWRLNGAYMALKSAQKERYPRLKTALPALFLRYGEALSGRYASVTPRLRRRY